MIPGIIELTSRTIYGLTSRNIPIYRFKPLNTSLPDYIVGCSWKEKTQNMLALVEPSKTTRTNLVRLLGPCGDIRAEREALLYQYSTHSWKKFDTTTIHPPAVSQRKILTGYTFNIDPVGCIDIDDVITIGDDGYMYITIADVASWMVTNPTLFQTASQIGQTLYMNGKVVAPLLPIEEQCSLLPGKERSGLALKFKWINNQIQDISFEQVLVTNTESFSYEEAQTFPYAKLLTDVTSYLASKDVTDSHEWIEQLMIFYNCEVATRLVQKEKGLLRYQDSADVDKIEYYRRFGISSLFLANKAAKYIDASTPLPHWGLSKVLYCHATSPIRRFADIVNQMVMCGYAVPEFSIERLNTLQTGAKKYERENFFLGHILDSTERSVEGIVLSDHRVWVPAWNRIVTCKNEANPGTRGTLLYSLNMNQSTWKRRMVFKFVDTSCLE